MTLSDIILMSQWFFLLYFIGMNLGYITLNIMSFFTLSRYMQEHGTEEGLSQEYADLQLPISILSPAYNEEATVAGSIRSLLQLNYPEYEIIVINDGSKDKTLEVLIQEFSLAPFPEAYRVRLQTKPVRTIYQSTVYPNLRVIDKENGGKADALNVGINCARYPLFCCIDADSILQRDSLEKVVQPFLEDPTTVASGGTVRIANGCEVSGGFLMERGLPSNPLALFQIVEYMRAFLFGRLGWSPLNALLIISGAFGVFHKEKVISAGGYLTNTIGEDMELVVRLHRHLRQQGVPYRITFVPDPICWTEAPEDLKTLKSQRVRWQRGLAESLAKNIDLLFNRKGGAVGWLAFPFMVIFEWLGPIIEVIGYIFMTVAFAFGMISGQAMVAFLIVAMGLGVLLSVSAFLLEEISFHIYPKPKHILILFLVAVAENFGYRQLNSVWRLMGLYYWTRGKKGHWGEMTRKASCSGIVNLAT